MRMRDNLIPGSARVSRAGFGVTPKRSFREARNFRVVLDGSGSPRLRDAIANTRDARATQPAWQHFITKSLAHASLEKSSPVFAIEFGDETGTNFRRANRFALVGIGAIAKTFRVHLAHHFQCARGPFRCALWEKCEM